MSRLVSVPLVTKSPLLRVVLPFFLPKITLIVPKPFADRLVFPVIEKTLFAVSAVMIIPVVVKLDPASDRFEVTHIFRLVSEPFVRTSPLELVPPK